MKQSSKVHKKSTKKIAPEKLDNVSGGSVAPDIQDILNRFRRPSELPPRRR